MSIYIGKKIVESRTRELRQYILNADSELEKDLYRIRLEELQKLVPQYVKIEPHEEFKLERFRFDRAMERQALAYHIALRYDESSKFDDFKEFGVEHNQEIYTFDSRNLKKNIDET